MIIAVDFDDTLYLDGKPNTALIRRLNAAQRAGDTVILWTCRTGANLAEAVDFILRHGLRPNYINCNAPEALQRFGSDCRKIFADVYIDDKAVRP